jgi:hypothetical protein
MYNYKNNKNKWNNFYKFVNLNVNIYFFLKKIIKIKSFKKIKQKY